VTPVFFPDTIFALSSGRLPSGVAVIRLTGPAALAAATAIAGVLPPPRRTVLRTFRHPQSGAPLDKGLLVVFHAPASASGEDMAEFHAHGGPAVVASLLAALASVPQLRPAEPGEFSRRAFLNGKLDLAQIEGLADLIEARTDAQRRQALAQMDGRLSRLYEGWRQRLIRILALVEADIDFADGEDDVPEGIAATSVSTIKGLATELQAHLDDGHRGERLRDGLTLAIIGPPNAGKSSLLNVLAKREAAIVSAIPGTTRDVIEVQLDLGGYPVTVMDTAGLRDTIDEIEIEGIRRARARADSADLVLHLLPADARDHVTAAGSLRVINKIDTAPALKPGGHDGEFYVSLLSGAGIDVLLGHLADWAASALSPGETPALTRTRHRHALTRAVAHLAASPAQPDLVLAAEDLRLAARALGTLTGRIDVEDVLDAIFRDFCIGK
jgi:tRNA modification GTPase